jgi:ACR3 family arsenite efflux pump ArsB
MYKGLTRSPVTIIVFSIITCGIYYLYWLWQVKNDVNGMTGRGEEISTGLYIISLFIPFLWLILWYKADNALKEVSKQKSVSYGESNFIIWIVAMAVGLGSFIAMFQIQEGLNNIWAAD